MSEYNNTIGPPAIFSSCTFDSLLALSDDEGAKEIARSSDYNVGTIGELIENRDIDTPEDLERMRGRSANES